MAFTIIEVTATYLKPDSSPATGSVTFIATETMRDTVTNESISPIELVAVLDETGYISVNLAATNGDFTTPRGVTYEVTERINDSNENKYFIAINKGAVDGAVDLADLVPNIQTVITQNYATKEYVDSLELFGAEFIEFTPTSEIFSTNVQDAIVEVREKSKFVFEQFSATTIWHINHNLRFYPNVTVVDSGDNSVIGDVEYIDSNNLIVTFAHSFAGKAYLS